MNRFFNQPAGVVDEILGGLARLAPVLLSEPGSGVRIVVRGDWQRDRVAIISGGGAGHEPAHAGFVGKGMLTAAVSGEIFASPSVEAVLAAIRQVTGRQGCLLIVKNYTGDRLNFGLAAERARAEGLPTEIVIVADDIALGEGVSPRGIAGTVLVHKYAGSLSESGASLDEIHTRVTAFAKLPMTLGLALNGCEVPGRPSEPRGPELGLGIHNETGAHPVNPSSAREAMQLVLDPLLAEAGKRYPDESKFVVLLNNLGGCSTQEIGVLTHGLLDILGTERVPLMLTPSPLMTSLYMPGFSVTLLPWRNGEFSSVLSGPTEAPAWPGVATPHAVQRFTPNVRGTGTAVSGPGQQDAAVNAVVTRIAKALVAAREELDTLDARAGDGDAGSTIAAGASSVLDRVETGVLPTADTGRLASDIGDAMGLVMGGSGGVLLSILFTATGAALSQGETWAAALDKGIQRMRTYGGAAPGDRTMLDALIPAVAALPEGAAAAAAAARQGANATAGMKRARAGRSAYVPESSLTGIVDPGAEAVARAFAALAAE